MNPLISINLVVYNEEKRIKDCLKAVFNQTYKNYEVLIFDNASTDKTLEVVKNEFPEEISMGKLKIFRADRNYVFGPGQNRAAKMTAGKYILGLCADVWIKEDFIEQAVKIMETDKTIGALQAKIYRLIDGQKSDIIDTCGFEIYKSRRVVNRGHGMRENDAKRFNLGGSEVKPLEEIFSYEGACPFWRREALEDTAIWNEYHDEDFVWYGDDIDLGWRMRLMGWKNYFSPSVIAWHERQTTKRLSTGKLDFIRQRKTLPKKKKMLDWVNMHLTFVKNDLGIFEWPDIYLFAKREIMLFGYALIFEPYTILVGVPRLIKYLPRALKKRKEIMKRRKISTQEIKKWYL